MDRRAFMAATFGAAAALVAGDWRDEVMENDASMPAGSPKGGWYMDLEPAMADARHHNVPVMLVVYSPKCPVCRKFMEQMANPGYMKAVLDNVVPLRMTQSEAYASYGTALLVESVPTIFLLTPEGELLVEPLKGAPNDPKEFVGFLKKVKSGYRELRRKKE